jgi:hypothetical protein
MREGESVFNVSKSLVSGGDYGIGMKVDVAAPHAVLKVTALQDADGEDINDRVGVGDALLSVDGKTVANFGSGWIRSLILGNKDTLVRLELQSMETDEIYELTVLRHVLVREWEEERSFVELRPELVDKELRAHSSILELLERARLEMEDAAGRQRDLLTGEMSEVASVGLVFASEVQGSGMAPRQVPSRATIGAPLLALARVL